MENKYEVSSRKYEVSFEIERPEIDFFTALLAMEMDHDELIEFFDLPLDEKVELVKKMGYVMIKDISFGDVEVIADTVDVQEIFDDQELDLNYEDGE